MGFYYNDPSGLGSWWVPDGATPLSAYENTLAASGITVDPNLTYSVGQQAANTNSPINQAGPQLATSPLLPITPRAPTAIPARHPVTILRARNPLYTSIIPGGLPPPPDNPCPPGYAYDEFNDECIPIGTTITDTPPLPGNQATSNVTAQVSVTVNNAVTLAGSAIDAITSAVTNAIGSASDTAIDVARSTASEITQGISDVVGNIQSGVNQFLGGLKSALSYITDLVRSHLGDLINFITNNLGSILNKVSNAITSIADFYTQHLKPILDNIQDVINKTIVPIFAAIQQTYQTSLALIAAIHADISNGIQGLLQLPSDISNSIASIEGTLGRVFDQLGLKKKDGTSVFIDPSGKDSVWDRLEHIGKGVNILGGIDVQKITFADFQKLAEPNLSRAGAKAIDAAVSEIADFLRDLISGTTRTVDAAKTGITSIPLLFGIEAGTWIGTWEIIRSLDRLFEPFYKFAEEDLAAKAGLAKLDVGHTLEAYRRSIINAKDTVEELAVRGWDETRINVLKDLQKYVVDIPTALDMYIRGITTFDVFTWQLEQHGVTQEQRMSLVQHAEKLFDVQTATEAFLRGLTDEKALDAVLMQHRYTNEEIVAYKATLLQPERPEHVLTRLRTEHLYSDLGFSPSDWASIPADLLAAAKRSALSAEVATDIWQASFYVHPLDRWIELYFRGIRTLTELHAALDYYRVPSQFRDDLIRSHQSLIPWRTIPTMLANEVISEPYAKQQLQAHGFDLAATEALLKYAALAHTKQKVVASGDMFGLSVGTARQYFDMGTITDEQYKEVLLAHGYNEQSADLAIHVETQHAMMLARKQLASDVIAEVNAGTITADEAIAQLDAAQFSPAEKSRVLNSIHRQKRQANKVPSEAELHSMAKAKVIDVDTYSEAMLANGWAQSWVEIFVKWRFENAAQTPSAT